MPGPTTNSEALVDEAARGVIDPSGDFIGVPGPLWRSERVVWAASLSTPSPASVRYQPPHPPGESCLFGIDLSPIVPPLVSLNTPVLSIFTNTAIPSDASADWTIGPLSVRGRRVYALLAGGVVGVDYRLQWGATDAAGNVWVRTALCLCSLG